MLEISLWCLATAVVAGTLMFITGYRNGYDKAWADKMSLGMSFQTPTTEVSKGRVKETVKPVKKVEPVEVKETIKTVVKKDKIAKKVVKKDTPKKKTIKKIKVKKV